MIFDIEFHFFYKISVSRTHINIQHTVDIFEIFKEGNSLKIFFLVGAQYTKSILYKWSVENGHIFMDGD